MKFETQHFLMVNNNNWDRNVWIRAPLPPRRGPRGVRELFIYRAILMKFETQHFNLFSNINSDRNLWIGAPVPHVAPPQKKKKLNSSFTSRFWWNLEHNIFLCLQIIIVIAIYEQGPLTPRGPAPPLKEVKLFIYWFIMRFWWNMKHNIFICSTFLNEDLLLLPSPTFKQSNFHLWCDFAEIWCWTF